MGARGPKPEPANVKIAKGNPGHRPIGADPVGTGPETGGVAPPSWLKKDGLAVWKRLAPRLTALKLLGPADAEAFARYCRNFGRWLRAQKEMDADGETYWSESAHGKLKRVNPAFLIADRLERSLQATEDRFGLNPAERQRIFAARAASGPSAGDLFSPQHQPSSKPTNGDREPDSAVGFLN